MDPVRERRWNRDRHRRIAEMNQRERFIAEVEWIDAMAVQLIEIRSLRNRSRPNGEQAESRR